ncbi:hypothetical protein E2C01_086017 [Portunus trituberculatus]|uniref:Uncharacterized protein n=1 Tax=Portunus trituberculatus TaxID=210409 RepID=A0A5B7J860_PORTR|nr:hypothetical protein [Portunus trituberculatus]
METPAATRGELGMETGNITKGTYMNPSPALLLPPPPYAASCRCLFLLTPLLLLFPLTTIATHPLTTTTAITASFTCSSAY